MKKMDTTDPIVIVSKREQVKDLLLGNTFSPSTVNGYCMAIKHAVRWMDLGKEKTQENERFYSDIGAQAMSAHKTAKNPNRQVRPRGVRTDEALEKFQESLKASKERNEDAPVPAYMPTKSGFRRQARVNIPEEAIPDKNLDVFKRIDIFRDSLMSNKGEPIQESTKNLYRDNIKLVIERYNTQIGRAHV